MKFVHIIWLHMQFYAVPQKSLTIYLSSSQELCIIALLVLIVFLQDIDFQTVAEVHFMSETKTESMDPAVIDEIGTKK